MPTTYAVVYSTATSSIRRIIADDHGQVTVPPNAVNPHVLVTHPDNSTSQHPLAPGEAAVSVIPPSVTAPARPLDWYNAVQKQTGVFPPDTQSALIDGGNVVQQMILAEPALDPTPPGWLMVQSYDPRITIGCTYDPATGLFTVPSYTLPPGVPGNPGTTPIVIPPFEIPKP